MKSIKHPFGQSAASALEAAFTEYELRQRRRDDLLRIKDKIEKGQLTQELYDFINIDGTMENLLPGLPRPTNGVACEGLSSIQLSMINATIAEEDNAIKNILDWLWEVFKNWFMDWWDRCRWEKRCLEYIRAQRAIDGSIFGSSLTFPSIVVSSFTKSEWFAMYNACQLLNKCSKDIIDTSDDKLKDAVIKVTITAGDPLDKFGKYIENGIIRSGTPKYTKVTRTCANGAWVYGEIGVYIDKALEILGDDISIRKQFNMLEHKFKNGNAINKDEFKFLKSFFQVSAEATRFTAGSLRLMLNTIRRRVQTPDYKLNHR